MSAEKLRGNEDLLVERLFELSLIDAKMFSFYLNTRDEDSYIYFGGYENSFIEELTWVKVKSSHWEIEL